MNLNKRTCRAKLWKQVLRSRSEFQNYRPEIRCRKVSIKVETNSVWEFRCKPVIKTFTKCSNHNFSKCGNILSSRTSARSKCNSCSSSTCLCSKWCSTTRNLCPLINKCCNKNSTLICWRNIWAWTWAWDLVLVWVMVWEWAFSMELVSQYKTMGKAAWILATVSLFIRNMDIIRIMNLLL